MIFQRAVFSVVLSISLLAGTVAAQSNLAGRAGSVSPLGQFLISLLVTLLVGGVLLEAAPEFVDATVKDVRSRPLRTTLIGTVALVLAGVILGIVSLFGLLGLIVGLPVTVAVVVLVVAGNAVGSVALGVTVLERVDNATNWRGLLLGAPLIAGTSVVTPVVPLGVVVSLLGIGAIVRERGPL